jgi:hypothetical protein
VVRSKAGYVVSLIAGILVTLAGCARSEQVADSLEAAPSSEPKPAPECSIRPTRLSIHLSQQSGIEGAATDAQIACSVGETDSWSRMSAGSRDLMVSTQGPEGSGRYWTIAIGVASQGEASPAGPVCVETSTIGWRSLQNFEGRALPWLEDVNGDGRAEVVLWESFPLAEEPIPPAFGLVAWVYGLDPDGSLSIDWDLSRQMARRVAAVYSVPLDRKDQILSRFRHLAGSILLQFAEGSCRVAEEFPASKG